MKTKRGLQIFLSRVVARFARLLHLIPPTLVLYSIEIHDNKGKFQSGYRSKCNSWVRNFYNEIAQYALIGQSASDSTSYFQDGYLNVRSQTGTISNSSYSSYFDHPTSGSIAAGDVDGIIVGLSDEAESFDSYKLGSKIAHGSGINQLYYGVQNPVPRIWNSVARKWSAFPQRVFTNQSSAPVTIKEIGYTSGKYQQFGGVPAMLLIRDVLSTPKVVNPGETATVTFTIEFPY